MSRNHPALATLGELESLVLGLQGKLALYRVLTRLVEAERPAAAASAFEAPG